MELGINQKRWVAALRSGEYKQCRNTLCKIDKDGNRSYCCLGVANVLFNLNSADLHNLNNTAHKEVFGLGNSIGGTRYFGSIKYKDNVYNCLAQANDSGLSFDDIANIIEANPELFFTHSV